MRKLKVLSVDWDYFFPDIIPFDWGHREEPLFLEIIWNLRANSRSILTGEYAVNTVNPDQKLLSSFWNSVVNFNYPTSHLIITDSHKELYTIMDTLNAEFNVDNFDQHHDISYSGYEANFPIDCSNWVGVGLKEGIIYSYDLWYPDWRRLNPEGYNLTGIPVYYGLPSSPKNFDVIFVCRSSAWTPSWADKEWIEFISFWKTKNPRLWKNKAFCSFVMTERRPNRNTALLLKEDFEEQLTRLFPDHSNLCQSKIA